MRAAGRSGRLPPRQDRRAVRRRRDCRARRRRARTAEPWRMLGEKLGEAYQVADDIRDAAADPDEIGKPTGRDAILGRPNAVLELGLGGAVDRLERLVGEAIAAIPPCRGAAELRALILLEAKRLLPEASSRNTRRDAPSPRQRRFGDCENRIGSQSSWLDRCFAARDRLLAEPAIPALGRGFPLTRPSGTAAGTGAVRSVRRLRLLAGAAGLRPAWPVRNPVEAACRRWRNSRVSCRLSTQATQRLLDAAASLRLVARRGRTASGWASSAQRCSAIRRRRDGRASSPALRRSGRSGGAAARRRGRDTALARYWPYAGRRLPGRTRLGSGRGTTPR